MSAASWTINVASKTFKREVALAGLLFWAVVTVRVFWYMDVHEANALAAVYGTMSTTVWLFAAGSFGIDCVAKQMGTGVTPYGSYSYRRTTVPQRSDGSQPADRPPAGFAES